jgi:putative PEP-CTERM system TPR-repeat lipoprotein
MTGPRKMPAPLRRAGRPLAVLLAGLLAAAPAFAQPAADRARAAQARGDLRAAQIEWRNAVRAEPNSAALRAGLAAASLELGDGDTAEVAARAALERGFDPVAGTALLLRSYAARNRFRELLRDFPAEATPPRPPAVAAQVMAGRAMAELALGDRAAARAAVEEAVRLAPGALEVQLAVAMLAQIENDLPAAEAAVERALAIDPGSVEGQMRRAMLQLARGQVAAAGDTLRQLLARNPGNATARVMRAEILMRSGDQAQARQEVDAALRSTPGMVSAIFLRAMLQASAGEWRQADESLNQISVQLPNLPDGFLISATVKRALNQLGQAEDAARRHFARRPEDPRGAKLLAAIEMGSGRADAAAGTLSRLVSHGGADAEAFDMLGRAHMLAGRPREAVEAFERAAALAPQDAGIQARLAAARLPMGNVAGSVEAAQEALRQSPGQSAPRQVLAMAALTQGDLATAEAELRNLQGQPPSEPTLVLEGTVKLARLDVAGARTAFDAALRLNPNSVGARLGLARAAALQGDAAEAVRHLGAALQADPDNREVLSRLEALAVAQGDTGAAARRVLDQAHAAAPNERELAVAVARTLLRSGEAARAIALIEGPRMSAFRGDAIVNLLLAEAYAATGDFDRAELASRTAVAGAPSSLPARQQLATLLIRKGDNRAAERVVEEALREQPGNPALQQMLVNLVQRTQNLDAALAAATRIADLPGAMPNAASLRGDLLMQAQRPADAASAYAAAYAAGPSSALAQRLALAWNAAGNADQARAALQAWLDRAPQDAGALRQLAEFDIQAGRTDEAVTRLEAVVAQQPSDAIALNNLAWLLNERGQTDRARQLAERAYFLQPGPLIADTLGWVLVKAGDPRAAVPMLRQAFGQTRQRSIGYRLAVALNGAGQREEATRLLQAVVQGDAAFPERAEAERLLGELRPAQ